jgi:hypothetical protein
MAKKAASKKRGKTKTRKKVVKSKKGRTTKVKYHSTKEIKVERALADNFIGLQKVMVNLSSKFDNLATQISKLLELFEISAKTMAAKDFGIEKENKETKKIMQRLDKISEHAGLIGKGLVLIHEAGQGLSPSSPRPEIKRAPPIRAPPRTPMMQGPQPRKTREIGGMQRSMSLEPKKEKKPGREEDVKTDF